MSTRSIDYNRAALPTYYVYILDENQAELDLGGIYETMRSRLPAYMLPTILEVLASLPTLPSGKVDRRSLPEPRSIGVNFHSNTG